MKTLKNSIMNSKLKLLIVGVILFLVAITSIVMLKAAYAQTDYYPIERSRTEIATGGPREKPWLTEQFREGSDYVTNVRLQFYGNDEGIKVMYDSHSKGSVTATFKVNAVVDGQVVGRFDVKTGNFINGQQGQGIQADDIQDSYNNWSKKDAGDLANHPGRCSGYIDKIIVGS